MSARETERNGFFSNIHYKVGTIAAVPALLLCAMLLLMLMLDIFIPTMKSGQYVVFPAAARIISLTSIFCMAACFGDELETDSLHVDLKDILFAIFAIWMLISTAVNGVSHDAIFGVAYRYVGVYDLMLFIFVYMYTAGRRWKKDLKTVFLVSYMTVSDLIAAAFLFNFTAGSIAAFNDKLEPAAIFYHGNHYGYYLVMVIVVSAGCFISYKGKMAVMGAASLFVSLGALAMNRSMGGILAAGSVLIVMIIAAAAGKGDAGRRALTLLAVLLISAAAALALIRPLREDVLQTASEFLQIISGDNNIYAGNGRWGIWQYVAEYIADYPVWGYGCEGIADIMKDYTLTTSPHNEVLTYAAFFGIPAAVFYSAAVIASVIKGIRNGRHDPVNRIAAYAVLGYFLSSIFGLAFFYTTPFEFIFIGLATQSINYSKFE